MGFPELSWLPKAENGRERIAALRRGGDFEELLRLARSRLDFLATHALDQILRRRWPQPPAEFPAAAARDAELVNHGASDAGPAHRRVAGGPVVGDLRGRLRAISAGARRSRLGAARLPPRGRAVRVRRRAPRRRCRRGDASGARRAARRSRGAVASGAGRRRGGAAADGVAVADAAARRQRTSAARLARGLHRPRQRRAARLGGRGTASISSRSMRPARATGSRHGAIPRCGRAPSRTSNRPRRPCTATWL